MIEQRHFRTTLGDLVVSGDAAAFDRSGLALLVLRGAFASETQFSPLTDLFPDLRVLFGHLPGFHAPCLEQQSIEAYCEAWSQVVPRLGGPLMLCGVSIGGVIALGLKPCGQAYVLAIDPPICPSDAEAMRQSYRPQNAFEAQFLWDIFGWRGEETAGRDYLPLLQRLTCPAVVLAGGDPGPGQLPGLISERTFASIQSHPLVRAERLAHVGHDVPRGEAHLVLRVIRNMSRLVRKAESAHG